ncbi:hypothetical protein HJG60_009430 [Phyllostomus discolor]|uniref:Uncharacterized protein n=1 Tax=Phyllostomus discolor TaxID=89673 RepID=A0A833YFX8_9CHIR|nr:hypothetical protein HJG60_009430 [Phyllostomus discolor]
MRRGWLPLVLREDGDLRLPAGPAAPAGCLGLRERRAGGSRAQLRPPDMSTDGHFGLQQQQQHPRGPQSRSWKRSPRPDKQQTGQALVGTGPAPSSSASAAASRCSPQRVAPPEPVLSGGSLARDTCPCGSRQLSFQNGLCRHCNSVSAWTFSVFRPEARGWGVTSHARVRRRTQVLLPMQFGSLRNSGRSLAVRNESIVSKAMAS